jgi:iduronate 2-sulfatase
LLPILANANTAVKPGAFTQHPRPAYYDRTPSGVPDAMGYSVRTARVRYTEWRDWKTGGVLARELYAHPSDEPELHNAVDRPEFAEAQREAVELLSKNFPPVTHRD